MKSHFIKNRGTSSSYKSRITLKVLPTSWLSITDKWLPNMVFKRDTINNCNKGLQISELSNFEKKSVAHRVSRSPLVLGEPINPKFKSVLMFYWPKNTKMFILNEFESVAYFLIFSKTRNVKKALLIPHFKTVK